MSHELSMQFQFNLKKAKYNITNKYCINLPLVFIVKLIGKVTPIHDSFHLVILNSLTIQLSRFFKSVLKVRRIPVLILVIILDPLFSKAYNVPGEPFILITMLRHSISL